MTRHYIGCKYKQKFNNANHFSRFFSVRGKKSVILTQKEWKVESGEWKVESGKWKVESVEFATAPQYFLFLFSAFSGAVANSTLYTFHSTL